MNKNEPDPGLNGRVVLVTGAAAGLGRALSTDAARRGAHVLLVDVDDASDAVSEIRAAGGAADMFRVDISVYADVAALAAQVIEAHGAVDVLVNNAAAGGGGGTLEGADPAAVRRMFEVNVIGTFNVTHAFMPAVRAAVARSRKAYVLNVGSEHSLGVPPHVPPVSAYTVSKYATLGFTQTAQRDLAGSGIQVSLLAPGWILTERIQARVDSSPHWAAAIQPYAQTPAHVAAAAWDGLLAGQAIIPTNPASRAFAIEHALEMMEAAQQLPKTEAPAPTPSHEARGDFSRCPMAGVGK